MTLPTPKGFKDEFSSVGTWAVKYGATANITNPLGGSGRVLQIQLNNNINTLITNGEIGGDFRIICKCRQSTNNVARPFSLAARVGGTNSARQAYLLRPGTSNNLRIMKHTGSQASPVESILAEVAFPNVPLSWYWLDFMLQGNKLYGTAWFAGDPRPEGWMVTATDNDFTTGEFGFQMGQLSDAFQFDLFSTTLAVS